jgi:hypothetical protein
VGVGVAPGAPGAGPAPPPPPPEHADTAMLARRTTHRIAHLMLTVFVF